MMGGSLSPFPFARPVGRPGVEKWVIYTRPGICFLAIFSAERYPAPIGFDYPTRQPTELVHRYPATFWATVFPSDCKGLGWSSSFPERFAIISIHQTCVNSARPDGRQYLINSSVGEISQEDERTRRDDGCRHTLD